MVIILPEYVAGAKITMNFSVIDYGIVLMRIGAI
jgi:hypothetical protein